jgi:16S rRNA (uracil1498-N3)-methyltransferase
MKAIYFDLEIESFDNSNIIIKDDKFHHLVNVMRIKQDEDVLIITNTKGSGLKTSVHNISKKELTLKITKEINTNKSYSIDLAFGVPKKDALVEILKAATEIGINKIIPIQTEYSWSKYEFSDRYKKIITTAVEQSNNLFFPEICEDKVKLNSIKFEQYDSVIYFSSNFEMGVNEIKPKGKILMIIGPEGGLSPNEERFLKDHAQITNLNVPILRAKTAVSFCLGTIISKLS